MATSVSFRLTMLCLGWLATTSAPVNAQDRPPPAYQLAAHQAGVPAAVLYAIALQESGTGLRGKRVPWPWTLNVAGQPRRFQTKGAACANLQHALKAVPSKRIDVGLGQINIGYHTHRVERPCDLLDPYRNLAITATILREQYRPGESWLPAIGRYHRPAGGRPTERYRDRVYHYLSRLHGYPASLSIPRRQLP